MSAIPARTRSQRRPTAESGQLEKSTADTATETPRERGNVSPSRLPKPQSVAAGAATSASSSRPTHVTRSVTSSTVNASTTRPPSQRTGVSRPPLTSDNKAPSQRSGARTPTETNSSLQRRPSTRHSRNASTSALPSRPSSSSSNNNTITRTQLVAPTGVTLIRPPSATSYSSTASTSTQLAPKDRPAFTTHLQHFSPLRRPALPKPSTSSILAPPSPSKTSGAIAASAETSRLQAELLQLHLLHHSAAPVLRDFQCSARTKLRARFEDVRDAHEQLVALETAEKERRTVRVLQDWDRHGGLDTKVQTLDEVLGAVWKVSELGGGGRYARVVRRFESWLDDATGILEARKVDGGGAGGDGDGDGMGMFVEELDAEWKSEVQNLSRKLAQWTQQLQALGEVDVAVAQGGGHGVANSSSSSLATVVQGVRDLVQGMVEEVRAMDRIEREVMNAEERWRREAIEEEDDDGSTEHGEKRVAGAIWRMVR